MVPRGSRGSDVLAHHLLLFVRPETCLQERIGHTIVAFLTLRTVTGHVAIASARVTGLTYIECGISIQQTQTVEEPVEDNRKHTSSSSAASTASASTISSSAVASTSVSTASVPTTSVAACSTSTVALGTISSDVANLAALQAVISTAVRSERKLYNLVALLTASSTGVSAAHTSSSSTSAGALSAQVTDLIAAVTGLLFLRSIAFAGYMTFLTTW